MASPQKAPEVFRRIAGSAFSYERVEVDRAIIYLLDPQFRIMYCNAAWNQFAIENGAPQLLREKIIGTSVLEVTAEPLKGFFEHALSRAQRARVPWEHDYECSSEKVFRGMRMRVFPLPNAFLLVENSLRVERPHSVKASDLTRKSYVDPGGMIIMCAHCRRTRHPEASRWDWVPAFVAKLPENASHGLCKNCRAFYFGS